MPAVSNSLYCIEFQGTFPFLTTGRRRSSWVSNCNSQQQQQTRERSPIRLAASYPKTTTVTTTNPATTDIHCYCFNYC